MESDGGSEFDGYGSEAIDVYNPIPSDIEVSEVDSDDLLSESENEDEDVPLLFTDDLHAVNTLPFIEPTGPRHVTQPCSTELDFFSLLIRPETILAFVAETNRSKQEPVRTQSGYRPQLRKCGPTWLSTSSWGFMYSKKLICIGQPILY